MLTPTIVAFDGIVPKLVYELCLDNIPSRVISIDYGPIREYVGFSAFS